jgi:thiamine kinase-like enzyme
LQDKLFRPEYIEGPFPSIKAFNDWFQAAAMRLKPGQKVTEPYRELLSDSGHIYFTHGDLTYGNIIISGEPDSVRITGIVDWEQSGWYPEYWEYCKLLFAGPYSHEWRADGWAESVMEPYEDELFTFGEYAQWRGP